MNLLYAIFFGAGVAAVAYTRLGRRAGYGNSGNVWLITGISFIMATIVFYTIIKILLGS
jgi:hypothetical protein